MNALEDEEDDSNKITVIQVCQEHDSASFVKSITPWKVTSHVSVVIAIRAVEPSPFCSLS